MKILFAFLPSLLAASDSVIGFEWGTVSATGLLGWYLWYTTKVVFPKHDDLMAALQTKCTDQLVLQREHYEDLLTQMQSRHTTRHKELLKVMERIVEKLEDK